MKNSSKTEYLNSPLGTLKLVYSNRTITAITFVKEKKKTQNESTATIQLSEYFSGKRKKFNIKFFQNCTPFQKKVYEVLLKIPYGETRTYAFIAKQIRIPSASRAVGNACKKNKIPIIIPCHRVIGKYKKFNYSSGSQKKKILMKIEGII